MAQPSPSSMPPAARRARRGRWTILLPCLALVALGVGLVRAHLGEARSPGLTAPPLPEVALRALARPLGSAQVRGTLRSASGAPVSEALVLARSGEVPSWTYSDERGAFVLSGLQSGPLRIRVCARRFEVEDFWVEAPTESARLLLTRALGPAPSLPPVERETLVGEVVAPWPEWVVTGYELALIPEEEPQTFGAPVPRRAEVRADRSFRFEELILGRYQVLLLPPWARGGSWPNVAAAAGRGLVHARTGAPGRLTVLLEAGILEAILTDSTGSPLEGALVLVHPVGDPARLWPPVTSEADGRLRLRDLPPGSYALTVSAGAAEVSRVVEIAAGASHRLDLPPLRVGGGR